MGSGAMIHIPNFIKMGSAILKLIGGKGDTKRHRQHSDRTSLLLFFQNKKNSLKITDLGAVIKRRFEWSGQVIRTDWIRMV
jgi:hypothetical protein